MNFLRSLFSYAPYTVPEVPDEEPPDPNADRTLPDAYRSARRTLVAACAICVAWSTAQFSVQTLQFDALGVSVSLSDALVPLLLAIALVYLTVRWGFEFAMMARHLRRWPLAQLDFRIVSLIARFSLLAVAAGTVNRSLTSVFAIVAALMALAVLSALLTIPLMLIMLPIRQRARRKVNRPSATSSAIEAAEGGAILAIVLTSIGAIALCIATYAHDPLKNLLWNTPPNPLALGMFVITLILVFLSPWILHPIMEKLFAERPNYRAKRADNGTMLVKFVEKNKEPLL